jgi:hypothetical protein
MSLDDPEQYRDQLAVFARRRNCRGLGWPRDWNPGAVISPASGLPYTESGAWELIADLLESGHPIEAIELRNPPGKTGFVMLYELEPGTVPLYIKIQFGSGKVIGRSFHISKVLE